MEASKLIGFFVGIGVAVLLIWAMFKRFNTDGSTKTEYDERQKTIRGIGYTYGYYTLMAYLALWIGLGYVDIDTHIPISIICFTGIMVSGLVLAGYCIMHDAYWGMNNDVNFYTKFFIMIAIANLIYGISGFVSGDMIVDGVLQPEFINFECGILLAVLCIMIFVKQRRDKKEEGEG